jgi:hypothetical protein
VNLYELEETLADIAARVERIQAQAADPRLNLQCARGLVQEQGAQLQGLLMTARLLIALLKCRNDPLEQPAQNLWGEDLTLARHPRRDPRELARSTAAALAARRAREDL